MSPWKIAGGVLAAAVAVAGAVVACTGSPSIACSISATDPRACTCSTDGGAPGAATCPAVDAGASICCASALWPASGGCECAPQGVGCLYGSAGCSCGITAAAAPTIPSCQPATEWTSCCKSASGCTCTILPDAGCDGVTVTSCSSDDVDGGTCSSAVVTCTCAPSSAGGSFACEPPTVACCLKRALHVGGNSSCTCALSATGSCDSDSTLVPSCDPSMVADAAAADLCAFAETSGTVVPSCQ
ncbi:MAG TPA: hypothetical protein VGH28_00290 [Polyangiaceae bacterium]